MLLCTEFAEGRGAPAAELETSACEKPAAVAMQLAASVEQEVQLQARNSASQLEPASGEKSAAGGGTETVRQVVVIVQPAASAA
jgi:hypothetical protein